MHLEFTVAYSADKFGVNSGVSCIGDHLTVVQFVQFVLLNENQTNT